MNTARQYQSAAEMIESAAAIRARLMKPANAYRPAKQAVVLKIVNLAAARRPLWRQKDIIFDEHVRTWQWYRATVNTNRYKEYVIRRCKEIGADYLQVIGNGQNREITGQRQLLMWELRERFDLSYPRIGREFGRDHTTVLHAIRRIAHLRGIPTPEHVTSEQRLLSDPELRRELRKDYERGVTVDDLADKYDLSENAIVSVGKTENWYNPNRKLKTLKAFTPVKVNLAEVRKDYEARQKSLKFVAATHGISDRTLGRLAETHGWVRRNMK